MRGGALASDVLIGRRRLSFDLPFVLFYFFFFTFPVIGFCLQKGKK